MKRRLSGDRRSLTAALQQLHATGLSHGSSGNISVRVEDGMLISPTGVANRDVRPEQLVWMSLDGEVAPDQLRPSSEWPMHAAIYRARSDAMAAVHSHSPYATALAATRRDIPAWHYMVAVAGGDSIPCADYATFGSEALSNLTSAALAERNACLLANHGQIAIGRNLQQAMNLAAEVEQLAAGYSRCLAMGDVKLLDATQMAEVLEKFASYGQQDEDA